MSYLIGQSVRLRALEPGDLDSLEKWENNPDSWEISNRLVPYSRHFLEKYLDQAHLDIYEARQFRYVIETIEEKKAVGAIDLHDYDPIHDRAGVGILIVEEDRNKGYAREALTLLKEWAFEHVFMHQLHCEIHIDNHKSIKLFESCGFEKVGVLKHWTRTKRGFKDVILLQCLED